jgi:hypothetical protein
MIASADTQPATLRNLRMYMPLPLTRTNSKLSG